MKKVIGIGSSCYNEEKNLPELYRRICNVFEEQLPEYDWVLVLGDNGSTDNSRAVMRELAVRDRRVKIIFNANNFGPVRSGAHVMFSTPGDCVIGMCSDLQDPPETIPALVRKWEDGCKVVCAVKRDTPEHFPIKHLRMLFYYLQEKLSSDTKMLSNFHGFGLYDRAFVEAFRRYRDPYPFFRGIVAEIGFHQGIVPYVPGERKGGKSSYNFFSYYDYAMTGFVNYSKLPLRLAVFSGFFLAGVSILIALGYLIYKLCYWDTFQLGLAPLVIGLFFFSAVQLIFIGIIGEYIGAIWTQVKNKPLVIEEERINFDQ